MTTMDSDSESQDSDDGRRFRFEATRKDSASSLNSRKRRSSPARRTTSRRSRSRDRGNRDRSRHDHRKDIDRRGEKNPRDRETKNSKNFYETTRVNSRYPKNTSDHRDTNSRSSRDSSRNHEKRRDEEKNSPVKYKVRNSSNENTTRKRFSRERSSPGSRTEKVGKSRKIDPKIRSNDGEKKVVSKDENLSNSRGSPPKQECKDLNLSDFDIVSDTEENSSENSCSRKMEEGEKSVDDFYKGETGGLKRRASKNHYERLLKRRELKNRRSSEELSKVKVENCGKLGTSNNNRNSDFLLGDDVRDWTLKANFERDMSDDDNKVGISSEDSESGSYYGPALPPKIDIAQGQRSEKSEKIKFSEVQRGRGEDEGEKIVTRGDSAQRDKIRGKIDAPQGQKSEKVVSQVNRDRRDEKRETIDVSRDLGDQGDDENEKVVYEGQRGQRDETVEKIGTRQDQRNCKDETCEKIDVSEGKRGRRDEMGGKKYLSEGQSSRNDEICEKLDITEGQKDRKDEKNEISMQGEKETKRIYGPTLPEIFRFNEDIEIYDEDTFGPALPPHLTRESNIDVKSKDDILDSVFSDVEDEKKSDTENIRSESENEDFMGPLPAGHPALENDLVQQQLERRARRLKAELAACDNEDEKKREEWMIELPPAQSVNLGLGPRKFRSRPAPDMSDRSSWTDTPADRARKRMEKLENKNVSEPTVSGQREISRGETEKSKKREKSLLEIHQKKLNKKKKKEEKEAKKVGKKVERRPFDRDVDLQANRFDEARKKSMVLKARELDDRFSRGKI